MSRRILVPVDDSPLSDVALDHAVSVHPDADLVVVHVVDPQLWISTDDYGDVMYSNELEETAKESADELLAAAVTRVENAGATAEAQRLIGQPANAIVEFVEENDVDQVVIGSHGRTGLDRLFLGSVAERVARRSPVPVTIVN